MSLLLAAIAAWSQRAGTPFKLQNRLLNRWELYPENFLGFLQVAAVVLLLRQF
jgi:hypothetical protein